jgi:NADPH-dependent ferric siderophore reductase
MQTLTSSPRRVERVRHELKRRDLAVLRVQELGPHLRSIVFGGPDLDGFVSASFDDHVKVFFPTGNGEAVGRDYTPRHYDAAAGELTIEFVLHGHGPAASWAAQAQPGQRLVIGGPRGSLIIPMDYDWHLFIGDESALPAITRRLEELPAGTPVQAILLAADAADRREFRTAAHVQAQWVSTPEALLDTARALVLPTGEGYAWCAGEAATMASLRRILVDDKGHDRHAIRAAAYWKQGASGHHENLE